ncbi:phage integrase family protein [Methanococcus maripaludis C5]|uniref:Phage integrase family protein n=1 Tax=Methanococcus maripaludis (strain C5 / ATCC BAA-1333) TaxID=402880 RepID=A4FXL2_METM5|nr:tyrosine-type recombinase/integrase [Methanococcus maripaludis]ABO34946.1 phage integrase family protein [Methanococcus maripaludis C5]
MILIKSKSDESEEKIDYKKLEIDKIDKEFTIQRRFDGLKERTIKNDSQRLKVYLNYIYYTLNKTVDTTDNKDYVAFFNHLRHDRKCKDTTINKYFKLLTVFYRIMKYKNFNDFLVESKERKRFTKHEIRHYDAIDEETLNMILEKLIGMKGSTKIRDATFLRLLWDTGCRVSEVAELTYSACDLKKGVFKLTNTKTKRERTVVCSKETLKLLNYYLQHQGDQGPDDYLFKSAYDGIINKRQLGEKFVGIVNELKREGSVPENKWLVLHSLRHGRAVNLLDKGVPLDVVKEYLGHTSIETTMIYSHSTERKNKMLDKISKIL